VFRNVDETCGSESVVGKYSGMMGPQVVVHREQVLGGMLGSMSSDPSSLEQGRWIENFDFDV
jgi:hypothetical protein